MQITRNATETMAGPSEWFTGAVYVDAYAAAVSWRGLSAARTLRKPQPTAARF